MIVAEKKSGARRTLTSEEGLRKIAEHEHAVVQARKAAAKSGSAKKSSSPTKSKKKPSAKASGRKTLLWILGIAIILLGLYLLWASSWETTPMITPGKSGIDVSHHNGKIDWAEVAASGMADFVYVKVTEGSGGDLSVDENGSFNIREARAQGLNVGAYHFLTTTSAATAQFANFKANCPKEVNLVPVIDFETEDKLTPFELRGLLKGFATLTEKEYGVKPIIYTTQSMYNNILLPKLEDFGEYKMFLGSPSHKPILYDGLSSYIWQYSFKGKVPGIHHHTDLSLLVGMELEDLFISR